MLKHSNHSLFIPFIINKKLTDWVEFVRICKTNENMRYTRFYDDYLHVTGVDSDDPDCIITNEKKLLTYDPFVVRGKSKLTINKSERKLLYQNPRVVDQVFIPCKKDKLPVEVFDFLKELKDNINLNDQIPEEYHVVFYE